MQQTQPPHVTSTKDHLNPIKSVMYSAQKLDSRRRARSVVSCRGRDYPAVNRGTLDTVRGGHGERQFQAARMQAVADRQKEKADSVSARLPVNQPCRQGSRGNLSAYLPELDVAAGCEFAFGMLT